MTHKLVKYNRPGAAIAYRVEVEGSEVGTMWFVKEDNRWRWTRLDRDGDPGVEKTRARAQELVLGGREPLARPRAAPSPAKALSQSLAAPAQRIDEDEPRMLPKEMTEAQKIALKRMESFTTAIREGRAVRIVWKAPLEEELKNTIYRPLRLENGMWVVENYYPRDRRLWVGAIWAGSIREVEIVDLPADWPTADEQAQLHKDDRKRK